MKAIVQPILSDDGDPFEEGDFCVTNDPRDGSARMARIDSIDRASSTANVEGVDSFLRGTGDIWPTSLASLTEQNIPGTPDWASDLARDYGLTEDDVNGVNAVMPEDGSIKAEPRASWPDDMFAWVPKSGPRKFPLSEDGETLSATRIHAAWQAVTKGLYGNKPKDIDPAAVKEKIKAAANKLPSGAEKDKVLAYIAGKQPTKALNVHDIASVAIKSLSDDRIGGYLVLWGDKQHPDLTGDWFTKSTEFHLDWFNKRPVLYHHSQDPSVKAALLGTVDVIEPDDIGLWIEAQVNKRNAYAKSVQKLIDQGLMGWSSGSASHLRHYRNDRAQKGEITEWPIIEATVTPTPAEPRIEAVSLKHFLDYASVIPAYKSLNLPVNSFEPQDDVEAQRQHSATHTHAEQKANPGGIRISLTSKDTKTMDSKEIVLTETELNTRIVDAIKADRESEASKAQAARDEEARIEAEVQRRVAAKPADPTKVLPAGQVLPAENKEAIKATEFSVGDDLRYAHMSSDDLAMMYMLLNGAASGDPQGSKSFSRMARRIVTEIDNDQSHKMQRRIAAKAITETNYSVNSALATHIYASLPYKSISDVNADNRRPVEIVRYDDKGNSDWAIKANELDSAGQANFVADWVNNLWSTSVILRRRIANPMIGILTNTDMPTNPFFLPVESLDPTVYYMVEGTDAAMLVLGSGNTASMSKVKSNKLTLTASKIGARLGYSTEVSEDALPFTIPQFNRQMKRVMQNYIDDTLINGDTQTGTNLNVNLIDGTPSSTAGQLPSYLALNGVRKFGLVTNTGQSYRVNGAPTLGSFRTARFTLASQYALDLTALAYVVDYKTYYKMLGMPEFLTYQNLGQSGSAVTGMLPMGNPDQLGDTAQPVGWIDGIRVFVSAQIGLAQTGASGTGGMISTTGANNTTGTALLIDTNRWFVGFRRGIEVQTFGVPYFSDTIQMVAMARVALTSFDTTCAVVMYDINVS